MRIFTACVAIASILTLIGCGDRDREVKPVEETVFGDMVDNKRRAQKASIRQWSQKQKVDEGMKESRKPASNSDTCNMLQTCYRGGRVPRVLPEDVAARIQRIVAADCYVIETNGIAERWSFSKCANTRLTAFRISNSVVGDFR